MSFEDTKPKTARECLIDAMEFLDDALFRFTCFVDSFKRTCKKAGWLDETGQLAEGSIED